MPKIGQPVQEEIEKNCDIWSFGQITGHVGQVENFSIAPCKSF